MASLRIQTKWWRLADLTIAQPVGNVRKKAAFAGGVDARSRTKGTPAA